MDVDGTAGDLAIIWNSLSWEGKGRQGLWEHIRDFRRSQGEKEWIIGDDFNATLSPLENSGGRALPNSGYLDFKKNCEDLALVDIFPKVGWHTWNNRRIGDENIRCRLDRLFVYFVWLLEKGGFSSSVLQCGGSDH
ncbi:hypothetical protein SUGI_0218430 [Cryptomeria japonica]|nr:hypothetical protein SUGI_0218430 [Cryptomeria japonica]